MPAPVVESVGTQGTGSSSTITVPAPAGLAVGDLLVVVIQLDAVPTVSTPLGWSVIGPATDTFNNGRMYVFYREVDVVQANYDFSASAVVRYLAHSLRVTGVNDGSPVNVSALLNGSVSSSTVILPSVTTTVPDCLLLGFAGGDDQGATTWAPPATMTEIIDSQETTSFVTIGAGRENRASAGSTGTRTFTASSTSNVRREGIILALAPSTATPQTLTVPLLDVAPTLYAPSVTDYEPGDPGELDPITGTVYISGETVRSVQEVRLFVDHANTGNLTVDLRPPDGAPTVRLFTQRGTGADIGASSESPLILRDDAAQTLAAGFVSGTGQTLRPEQALSTFRNESGGEWQIIVTDVSTGQTVVLPYARVETTIPKASKKTLKTPLHTVTPSLFPPSLSQLQRQSLQTPLLTVEPVLFAPTVVPRAVTLGLPLLDVAPVLYAPTIGVAVGPPLLTVNPDLFAPGVVTGPVRVTLPLLEIEPELLTPTVRQRIVIPRLTVAPQLFAPEVFRRFLGTRVGYVGARPGFSGDVRTGYIDNPPHGKVR